MKADAAHPNRMAIHAHGDAVAHVVFRLVGLRHRNPERGELVQDRLGDGMAELVFGSRGPLQDLRLGILAEREDSSDFRALAGECAGLVKEEGIHLAHQFQRASILDQNAVLGAQRQRGQHAQRSGHANTGAEIAIDHRRGAIDADGAEAEARQGQRRDDRLVGQFFSACDWERNL